MRKIIIPVKILISVLLLWFLTHTSKLDFSLLPQLLYSPGLLACTMMLYFAVVIVSAWRWYQLNTAQAIQLNFRHTLIPTYLGIAFNNLLPGGIGGDFFRCYFLFKKTDKRSAVMLSILFDRITGLMGIFIAVCLCAAMHLKLFTQQNSPLYFIFICLILCLSLLIVFFGSILLPQQLGLSTWLCSRFAGKKWLTMGVSLINSMRVYRNSKLAIFKCLIASVIIQLMIVMTCSLIAKIMHFPPISFTDYMIAAAVTQLVNLIPIAPGGFGIGEAAFANIIVLLNPGVNATYATIFLAYRVIGILTYLPGLAVFIFDSQLLKKKNELNENSIETTLA